MTIRDCIVKAAAYLGLKDIKEHYESEDTVEGGEFLEMATNVVAEICCDYYPLKISEQTEADGDGLIRLGTLTKPVIDVFKIIKGGVSVPFLIKYDRLEVGFCGKCQIEYSYMPSLAGLDTELPFTDRVSERVIAYGIAAEYALINAPEDAPLFDKRFKDALKKAVIQKSEKRVKGRDWL